MTSALLKLSDRIYAELTATIDSLGYNDGVKFHLDKNCIEVIKDLIRHLRRDDDTHSIRRFLGESKVLQRDLIKIFVDYSDKIELWNVLLRLLINLTSPALMVYNEELPTEIVPRSYYLQILSHLQDYKSEMSNDAVWIVVHDKLKNILSIDSSERGEENEMIIERILTLIRNVLRVPASDYDKRTDNDTTIHDEVLFALHTSGISDLLVYIASTINEQQYHMQILEIIAFMLRSQNPARLAKVDMQRSDIEKQADEAKLMVIRQKEIADKMSKMKKYAGSRHSRFGGTFIVQNMKAIGDNEMICHKPYKKIEDLDFSVTKQKTKRRRNKNCAPESSEERVSALSVRLFLKEFCVEFLNGAYNPVMRYVRSCISGGVSGDSSHYLWALRFFMCFNRHYKFRVKYVSETISTEVFYIVQRDIEHNYEMITTDKKKIAHWSTRLHLALNAYQELLLTLVEMDRSTDEGVKRSSRVIMSNIFYVPEYRDTILSQLLNYNELSMSRAYLVDLVTTVHIFLKMLKNHCDKERNLVVRKVKRKKPKKKAKPSKSGSAASARPLPSLEDRWDEFGPEVSAVLQQGTLPEVMPFDATIPTAVDEQKEDAMKRVQKLLRSKDYEQAVGLLRSARDVWPENDSFGRADMPVEEEFLVLREIFFADLGVSPATSTDAAAATAAAAAAAAADATTTAAATATSTAAAAAAAATSTSAAAATSTCTAEAAATANSTSAAAATSTSAAAATSTCTAEAAAAANSTSAAAATSTSAAAATSTSAAEAAAANTEEAVDVGYATTTTIRAVTAIVLIINVILLLFPIHVGSAAANTIRAVVLLIITVILLLFPIDVGSATANTIRAVAAILILFLILTVILRTFLIDERAIHVGSAAATTIRAAAAIVLLLLFFIDKRSINVGSTAATTTIRAVGDSAERTANVGSYVGHRQLVEMARAVEAYPFNN